MSKVTKPIHGKTYYYVDKGGIRSWTYRSGCSTSNLLVKWGVLYESKEELQQQNKKDNED